MNGSAGAGRKADSDRIDTALLAAARRGEGRALDKLLGELLPLLRAHAARRLDDRLRGRLGASDLVQMTLIEASRGIGDFEGRTKPQLRAWLLRILRTNHLDELKALLADKRGAGLERSLDELLGSTVTGNIAAPDTTPSRQVARRQELRIVSERLAELTEPQKEALLLRIEGFSVKQIAGAMGRSEDSVASLLKRALEHVRRGEEGDTG